MKLGPLLDHLRALEGSVATELRAAAERHRDDHDVFHQCLTFAVGADERAGKLEPHARRYPGRSKWASAVGGGSEDLLEELRALFLRLQEVSVTWTMAVQAAMAARDQELLTLATSCAAGTETQAKWLMMRIKTGAPQALVVA